MLFRSIDPGRYNGACMVGLGGIVVKSHGRANGVAFSRAIVTAALAARRGLTEHIAQALQGASHAARAAGDGRAADGAKQSA